MSFSDEGYKGEVIEEDLLRKFVPKNVGDCLEGRIVEIFVMTKYTRNPKGYVIEIGGGERVLFVCGGVMFARLAGDRLSTGDLIGIVYKGLSSGGGVDGKRPARLWSLTKYTIE